MKRQIAAARLSPLPHFPIIISAVRITRGANKNEPREEGGFEELPIIMHGGGRRRRRRGRTHNLFPFPPRPIGKHIVLPQYERVLNSHLPCTSNCGLAWLEVEAGRFTL